MDTDGLLDALAGQPDDDPMDQADAALAAVDRDVLDALAPRYPAWLYATDKQTGRKTLSPPKRPKPDVFKSWAQSDHDLHGLLLLRFLVDLRMYDQGEAGVFADFRRNVDEAFVSTEPTTQCNKLCNMLAGVPARVAWAAKTIQERTAAQDAEDWALWFLDEWARIHRDMGNAALRWELEYYAAVYGRKIARVLPDPDDPGFPWRIDLMDPATCFPVWGDKWGLLRMTQISVTTLGKVIDGFDAKGERKLHAKFVKHYGRTKSEDPQVDFDREGELIDVWTRWSRCAFFDGVLILCEDHELGRVPFVYRLLPGKAGGSSTPEVRSLPIALQAVVTRNPPDGIFGQVNDRQLDVAMKGLSFFHPFKNAIKYEEKLYGLLMTLVKLDANPPMITTTNNDDVSPVDLRPKGHTRRRPGEKTEPITVNARTGVIGPVATLVRSAQMKAGFPDNVFGMTDQSQVSGFAQNTLIAATKDRLQPYIDCDESFLADVLDLAAYLFHGFGHTMTDDAATGELVVPRRQRGPSFAFGGPPPPGGGMGGPMGPMGPMGGGMMGGGGNPGGVMPPMGGMGGPPMGGPMPETDTPEVRIRRETFDLVGFRPKVTLEGFDWNQMTVKANVAQLLTQSNIWSEYTARDKLGVENPDQEGQWIDAEMALKHPLIVEQIRLPKALLKAGYVEEYQRFQLLMQQQAIQAGSGGGPPQQGNDGSTNGGSVRGVQTAQGDSRASVAPPEPAGRPIGGGGEDVGA